MRWSRATPRPRSVFRRVERAFIGFLMTIMAFFLERIVMRGIRKEGGDPAATSKSHGGLPPGTSITTKGGDIDFEPDP